MHKRAAPAGPTNELVGRCLLQQTNYPVDDNVLAAQKLLRSSCRTGAIRSLPRPESTSSISFGATSERDKGPNRRLVSLHFSIIGLMMMSFQLGADEMSDRRLNLASLLSIAPLAIISQFDSHSIGRPHNQTRPTTREKAKLIFHSTSWTMIRSNVIQLQSSSIGLTGGELSTHFIGIGQHFHCCFCLPAMKRKARSNSVSLLVHLPQLNRRDHFGLRWTSVRSLKIGRRVYGLDCKP